MCPEQPKQSPTTDAGGGIVPLHDLGILVFEGTDAIGFLQGYLTTDTAELAEHPAGRLQFTAMCNIKGRVVCTGYARLDGQAVTLILHRSLCSIVLDFLRPYVAFSRTVASAVPGRIFGVLHWGPAPASQGPLPGGHIDEARQLLVLDDAMVNERLRDAPELPRTRWDRLLIERREVWLQAETSGKFLPQMIGLDELGAVNFSKGCYLGQEVVARAQHRGQVKRRLTVLDWSGAPPAPGTAIEAAGREVGTVVSSTGSHEAGQALAVMVLGQSGPLSSPRTATRFIPSI